MDQLLINPNYPHILSTLIFLPLAGAVLLLFVKNEFFARYWALGITALTAILSIPLVSAFDTSSAKFQFVEQYNWVSSLNIQYVIGIDGISILLVMLTTFIMPLCILASWSYIKTRVQPFMICLLIMETAMLGVFMALDFVLFYILWEAMLIPMYLLIGIWGGPRKIYASIKFFLYTLSGSIMLLVAIIWLYKTNNYSFFIPDMMWQNYSLTAQIYLFIAFFLAFAIKVPMFPFHTWLPAAHVEAPTAGSVILASVLLKMGTYGFLRFALPITPEATTLFMPYVLWLSIAGIIYGGFTALAQQDMKKLIAYSSVGHMGFVTLGIFVLNIEGVEGSILQMINHGITTGALFLCVGMIYERTHSRELRSATGVGKYMPIYVTFLTFFSLSSFGFPGTNSFVGEFMILAGTFKHSTVLALAAIPGAVLAAAYMLRMLQKIVWGGTDNPDQSWLKDLNLREIIILCPFLFFVFWIGLGPQPFIDLMHISVVNLLDQFHAHQGQAVAAAELILH
ncbi:MAG: NADH-quinone oxidoreductase subunit M [Proteobacteria bacterium]|jgi:NADH-quinone oxidoreductase subunit M|nr:NADH-quinone oxidoreductase subunit M [Desulfocapsa sp.]MBU3945788.1 NADH-quinone oxidoreductase subunit M [Pseudomonadota bacterium]MCG2745434.1 NADH-quinone oxidoreductase subunit M [Desulfobacteraceae bacterium]MDO8947417.1 NADH-quinone oxidoreductase subunit M [Desulfocapsaceae bacterium]MBU4030080.1 NADH-quinone oxidoreductase subunit M [Pseudomonadota bacterium]